MADEKANAHSEILPEAITANHIVRTSKNDATGNNKLFLTKFKNFARFNATVVAGAGSSISGDSFLSNITLDLSAGGVVLSDVTIIGSGQTIVFPANYTATGKVLIVGGVSTFEYELDLDNGAIYNATGGGTGSGLLTIPSGLEWVGKYIFINDYAVIEEIANLSHWSEDVIFQADIADQGFTFSLLVSAPSATANQIITPVWLTGGTASFDWVDVGITEVGYAVIKRSGNFNLYIPGKSFQTN